MDRATIQDHLGSIASTELNTEMLYISPIRVGTENRWYSADPFPLANVLRDPEVRSSVEANLIEIAPVPSRIRVAARSYSDAFWATSLNDSALRLGMPLDALVGATSGLPTRALAERFALLDGDPAMRSTRYASFQEYYGVRSAIAHGGKPSDVSHAFLTRILDDVRWVARRMERMQKLFAPKNESEVTEIFEGLRWGTHSLV